MKKILSLMISSIKNPDSKKKRLLISVFFLAIFVFSFFLNWQVFKKTAPDFPVVYRSNDLGLNLLGRRTLIWEAWFLGLFFLGINYLLSRFFGREERNLSLIFFFVNIGIAFLVLIISSQVYFLNR
ncbi:MAG: hypothetical protein WC288_01135 [Candidatus Paceibacterota bacterium]|jgi:hypothetical protein|nr:hypothetical protein [Candidatus Paceibacterota bacterium]MDD3548492.1 hypothetical protein [Candidatus Paceibacterota bacterium]MDD4999175.1 hypothetical protein [Candidatus Paceibacterota bacterium]MDD5545247.1 hypothetical protein [Candidatus Paceibacterota bacterium]